MRVCMNVCILQFYPMGSKSIIYCWSRLSLIFDLDYCPCQIKRAINSFEISWRSAHVRGVFTPFNTYLGIYSPSKIFNDTLYKMISYVCTHW